jgi:hypothetical protein
MRIASTNTRLRGEVLISTLLREGQAKSLPSAARFTVFVLSISGFIL